MKTNICFVAFQFVLLGLAAQPKMSLEYTESNVVLKTPTGNIDGTLTLSQAETSSPVVLIVPGSGPTDRDGNSGMGVQANVYKMLSEELAKKGIASLRFDKRGIGKSKSAMTGEKDLRFETYIDDVVGWIVQLRLDKRFSAVLILGHSEGSLIGMVASEHTPVDGFISISGAGKPADRILREQLETKLPPDLLTESNAILDSLKDGKTIEAVNPNLAALYRPSVQPYMISWFKYDPAKEIAKLKIPILIIQGTTDLQVTINDAKLLSAANSNAQLLIVDNMNHVLKESSPDPQQNYATYQNPNLPLKEGLVDRISQFVMGKN